MRLSRLIALVFAFVATTSAFAHASTVAPADEYFGPFKQSILEVRNRIMRFEGQSSRELARNLRGLDTLEITISDWYRKYPRDPWIPGFERRLIGLYHRAHVAREANYAHAIRIARLAAVYR